MIFGKLLPRMLYPGKLFRSHHHRHRPLGGRCNSGKRQSMDHRGIYDLKPHRNILPVYPLGICLTMNHADNRLSSWMSLLLPASCGLMSPPQHHHLFMNVVHNNIFSARNWSQYPWAFGLDSLSGYRFWVFLELENLWRSLRSMNINFQLWMRKYCEKNKKLNPSSYANIPPRQARTIISPECAAEMPSVLKLQKTTRLYI